MSAGHARHTFLLSQKVVQRIWLLPERLLLMNQSAAVWLLILLAVVAANLPFINERLLAVISVKRFADGIKPFWVRVLELLFWYGVIGLLGMLFERMIGNTFAQRWEFYVTALSLFVVLAFPGFVVRYLLKR